MSFIKTLSNTLTTGLDLININGKTTIMASMSVQAIFRETTLALLVKEGETPETAGIRIGKEDEMLVAIINRQCGRNPS